MAVEIIVAGANGRMGRAITECIGTNPDCLLAGAVDTPENLAALAGLPCVTSDSLKKVLETAPEAVVIDFTAPAPTMLHAETVAAMGAKMVIGTTGLDAGQKNCLASLAREAAILWSANMSVGINVLLNFLPRLAQALGEDYDVEMMELHHRRKKDAPSGTALMLGEAIAAGRGWDFAKTRVSGRDGLTGPRPSHEIGVQALRGGDVVGIHSIYFLGQGELLEITHQAESRENFAQGALRAAIWLRGQEPGRLYSMRDVIAINKMS